MDLDMATYREVERRVRYNHTHIYKAAIGIGECALDKIYLLFPSSQLVVYSQRNAFLESTVMIGCKSDHKLLGLKSQAEIKVLRDGVIRPELD
jgi:hypothetical protein